MHAKHAEPMEYSTGYATGFREWKFPRCEESLRARCVTVWLIREKKIVPVNCIYTVYKAEHVDVQDHVYVTYIARAMGAICRVDQSVNFYPRDPILARTRELEP